jgi:hypothetical protein
MTILGQMVKQRRWTVTCLALLIPALLAPADASLVATYDEEGVPTACPSNLPPTIGVSLVVPQTFAVQKWAQPAGAEVPFRGESYQLWGAFPAVMEGEGWYVVHPRETEHENQRWRWEGEALGRGGILCTCRFINYVVWAMVRVTWTGVMRGHAFPLDFGATATRPTLYGGGSEGEWQCWELVAYGYDGNGEYWEVVIDSWCENVQNEQ